MTPYYNKASQPGLIRHYTCIADAVNVPIILYNVPSRTGVNIAPESYAELSKHPNIMGTKEASSNFSNLQRTLNLCPEDFYIWSGNDDETLPICALGGVGVISVAANILPAEMHALASLCLDGDFSAARELQLYLKDFCDTMFCEVNPIPVKAAMNLLGMEAGALRLPLYEANGIQMERIRKTLVQYRLLQES